MRNTAKSAPVVPILVFLDDPTMVVPIPVVVEDLILVVQGLVDLEDPDYSGPESCGPGGHDSGLRVHSGVRFSL